MISVIVYIAAAIIHFIKHDMPLFWVSVLLLVLTTGLSLWMSYFQVGSLLKQQRQTAKQMELDGVSEEKILAYIDQDIDESQYREVPEWMHGGVLLGVLGSVVLLVIGLFN